MVNKHIVVGRLGQDVEVRYTQAGTPVASFSVATSEKWKDKSGDQQEKTTWHDVVCFGKLAEICNEYISKGSLVYIEGPNEKEQWQDKDGNKRVSSKIKAREMKMLDGKSQQSDAGGGDSGGYQQSTGEDVPF